MVFRDVFLLRFMCLLTLCFRQKKKKRPGVYLVTVRRRGTIQVSVLIRVRNSADVELLGGEGRLETRDQ